jgi:hypothetical protein
MVPLKKVEPAPVRSGAKGGREGCLETMEFRDSALYPGECGGTDNTRCFACGRDQFRVND